jgi:hypothetical protein
MTVLRTQPNVFVARKKVLYWFFQKKANPKRLEAAIFKMKYLLLAPLKELQESKKMRNLLETIN